MSDLGPGYVVVGDQVSAPTRGGGDVAGLYQRRRLGTRRSAGGICAAGLFRPPRQAGQCEAQYPHVGPVFVETTSRSITSTGPALLTRRPRRQKWVIGQCAIHSRTLTAESPPPSPNPRPPCTPLPALPAKVSSVSLLRLPSLSSLPSCSPPYVVCYVVVSHHFTPPFSFSAPWLLRKY